MAKSNNEKSPSDTGRLLYFPGVRGSTESECIDMAEQNRRGLAKGYREALGYYFELVPDADRNNVIEDSKTGEIRIPTQNGDISVVKIVREILKEKSILKALP